MKSFFKNADTLVIVMARYGESQKRQVEHWFLDNLLTKKVDKMYAAVSRFLWLAVVV